MTLQRGFALLLLTSDLVRERVTSDGPSTPSPYGGPQYKGPPCRSATVCRPR